MYYITINSIYSRLGLFRFNSFKALVQYLKDNNITIYVLTLIIVKIYFYIH